MQKARLEARNDSQEKSYRWPQKVHRYGLMKHPFLRLFVALYENKVPWNTRPQGWCAESLREYIRTHMLPTLEPVDPRLGAGKAFGAAYYIDRINLDAALQEAADPGLAKLRNIRAQNPQLAEREAIRHFNERKYATFHRWWRVMQKNYASKPEWVYCLLRRVFATSGRDSRAPVPAVRLKTVRKLAEAVTRGEVLPPVGLSGAYLLKDAELDTTSSVFHPNGWTRVAKGVDHRWESKLKLLSYFGMRAGWCIRNVDTAFNYLRSSDFYVLCSGGSPVVAVRCTPEPSDTTSGSWIQEVAGISNRPVHQYPAVDLLLSALHAVFRPRQSPCWPTGSQLSSLDLDGWSRVLEVVPFAIQHAPVKVRRSAAIREKTQVSMLRYIHRDPFWIQFFYQIDEGGKFLTDGVVSFLEPTLCRAPFPVKYCKIWIFRNARLRSAWEMGWTKHLKESVTARGVPRRLLSLPENRQLALAAFKNDLAADGVPAPFHPLFREEPGLFEAWRQSWIRNAERTPSEGKPLPFQLWEDRQFVAAWAECKKAAVSRDGRAPKRCLGGGALLYAVWCDLWITAVKVLLKKNGPSLRGLFIPKPLRKHPGIRNAFLEAWIGHMRSSATTRGVPRRVLALPEIRPLALDAFQIDLACSQPPPRFHAFHGDPPRFHAFYGEEPGLRDAWQQAWLLYVKKAPRSVQEVPSALLRDKTFFSAWFGAHLRACKRGETPKLTPKEVTKRSIWRALWVVYVKDIVAKLGNANHVDIPLEVLKLPIIQRVLTKGWLVCLEKQMKWDASGLFPKGSNVLFFQLLAGIQGVGRRPALRDFVLGYLRLAARWKICPAFETLSAPKADDSRTKYVLRELGGDLEFESLWINAWREAVLEHLPKLANDGIWRCAQLPPQIAAIPEVRAAAGEAYLAFLGRLAAAGKPAHVRGIPDLAGPASVYCVESAPEPQVPRGAEETVAALLEKFALGEDLAGMEAPPEALAEDPELCRQWAELWPRLLAARIPLENMSLAAGCTENCLPAEAWKQPWSLRLQREIVLRFLSLRGAGRPLAANDSLPRILATDPEVVEAWIATWERVLQAMPQEYAVYRRVALNVQHVPRVFHAWLQAVRPLNRLFEEEEAWRGFLVVNSADLCPPFLPRVEILERNAKLQSLVRKMLQHDLSRSSGAVGDFVARGLSSLLGKTPGQPGRCAASLSVDLELLREAFELGVDAEASTGLLDQASRRIWGKACNTLRAAPWLLEWLPGQYAEHPWFQDAVLSGWQDYLRVAPWLLPHLPAAWSAHFEKTRSEVKRIAPPPAERAMSRLRAAA
jgi:hypothetical protein